MPRRLVVILLLILVLTAAAGYSLIGVEHIRARLGGPQQSSSEPAHLVPGKGLYTLLLSARILPGAAGSLRIALEGAPGMNYSLFDLTGLLKPAQHDGPVLHQNRLALPGTAARLELGIVLQPKPPAPVDARLSAELPACCRGAGQLGHSSLASVADYDRPLQIRFYDDISGKLVLKIPVLLGDQAHHDINLNNLFQPDSAPSGPVPIRHG